MLSARAVPAAPPQVSGRADDASRTTASALIAFWSVGVGSAGPAGERTQHSFDPLQPRRHDDTVAVVEVTAAHCALGALAQARQQRPLAVAPRHQGFQSGTIPGETMQRAQRSALLLEAGKSAHALLSGAGGRLQSLNIGGRENARLAQQELLELGEKSRLLAQKGREVLAADTEVHASASGKLGERLLELNELVRDVLRLHGVGSLLDGRLQLRHARTVHCR